MGRVLTVRSLGAGLSGDDSTLRVLLDFLNERFFERRPELIRLAIFLIEDDILDRTLLKKEGDFATFSSFFRTIIFFIRLRRIFRLGNLSRNHSSENFFAGDFFGGDFFGGNFFGDEGDFLGGDFFAGNFFGDEGDFFGGDFFAGNFFGDEGDFLGGEGGKKAGFFFTEEDFFLILRGGEWLREELREECFFLRCNLQTCSSSDKGL